MQFACGSIVRDAHLCAVFPRSARKNRTPTKRKYRSAEGKKNADRVTRVIYIYAAKICSKSEQ